MNGTGQARLLADVAISGFASRVWRAQGAFSPTVRPRPTDMGLLGAVVGGSVVGLGVYVFYRGHRVSRQARRAREAPHESLLRLQDVVLRSQQRVSGDEGSTDAQDYRGPYLSVRGIVMSDHPMHCSVGPGKVPNRLPATVGRGRCAPAVISLLSL